MPARSPPSKLTDHLGYWMRMVSNQVSHAFARAVEGRGVTVAEWVVLRELFDVEALPPSKLADTMGMTRGAISKLAERLIAKGLVQRTESPSDGRVHTLSLTEQGARLVPELAGLADANDASFFDCLSSDERRQLERALQKIVDANGLRTMPVS